MPIDQGEGRKEINNRFLLALPATSLSRLEPHFEPLVLQPGVSLGRIGSSLQWLTFVNRGFVSITKTMGDGRTVEIGAHGNSDIVGLFGLYGIQVAAWDSVVQIPGTALRLKAELLRAEVQASVPVRRLLERYTHQVLSGLAQTAACHRLHSLKQRFCRWLLAAQDNAMSDTLPLTHETLALMLGVQRSGVSIVASAFQKQRALRTNRGSITILDRKALEADTCECYEVACRAYNDLLGPAPHASRGRG